MPGRESLRETCLKLSKEKEKDNIVLAGWICKFTVKGYKCFPNHLAKATIVNMGGLPGALGNKLASHTNKFS